MNEKIFYVICCNIDFINSFALTGNILSQRMKKATETEEHAATNE